MPVVEVIPIFMSMSMSKYGEILIKKTVELETVLLLMSTLRIEIISNGIRAKKNQVTFKSKKKFFLFVEITSTVLKTLIFSLSSHSFYTIFYGIKFSRWRL